MQLSPWVCDAGQRGWSKSSLRIPWERGGGWVGEVLWVMKKQGGLVALLWFCLEGRLYSVWMDSAKSQKGEAGRLCSHAFQPQPPNRICVRLLNNSYTLSTDQWNWNSRCEVQGSVLQKKNLPGWFGCTAVLKGTDLTWHQEPPDATQGGHSVTDEEFSPQMSTLSHHEQTIRQIQVWSLL